MKMISILVYTLVALLSPFSISYSADQPGKKVILVLDASGSMWGKLKGKAKIVIARSVVKELLNTWDNNTELGLIAYGHRVKGSCKDIETLIPVSKVNVKNFMKILNAVSPKGKTPIGAAVLKAAETLKYTEESATVILVSDGIDTCGMDLCKLASKLKKSGVDFKTHVIGFDIRTRSAVKQLQCLAKKTGGNYFAAKDAAGLKTAMATTVKLVAKAKPIVVKAKPKPKPKAQPDLGPGLLLSAVITKGATAIEKNVHYNVYEPQKDIHGKRKRISQHRYKGRKTVIKLAPGKVVVVAHYGINSIVEAELEVKDKQLTEYIFDMNVGSLALSATAAKDSKLIDKNVHFSIYLPEKDLNGKRKLVSQQRYKGNKTLVILKAGKYHLQAHYGVNSIVEADIEIKAKQLVDHTFNMNVGTMALSATADKDSKLLDKNVHYSIYHPEKDLHGKRKLINQQRYKGNKTLVTLKAGKYHVVANYGVNAIAESEVEIKANQLVENSFNMDVGNIALSAAQAPGAGLIEKNLHFYIYDPNKDLHGKRKLVSQQRYKGNKTVVTLKSGKYYLRANYGINGLAEKQIEIKPNQLVEQSFDMNTGAVAFSGVEKEGGVAIAKNMHYYIYLPDKDIHGKRKLVNQQRYKGNKTVVVLKAGKYHIQVQYADKKVEKEIEIKANALQEIVFVMK